MPLLYLAPRLILLLLLLEGVLGLIAPPIYHTIPYHVIDTLLVMIVVVIIIMTMRIDGY